MTRVFPGDRRLARQHLVLGNYARAYELDPSLRRQGRPSMALDAATEERIISRAIRAARAAAPRHATERTLAMFDPNSLLQRAPGDRGYRERRSSRTHALDAASSDDAAEHIRRALYHLKHGDKLDTRRLRGYLEDALDALSEAAHDRDDDRLDEDEVTDPTGHGGPPRIHDRARDAMGETAARSSVSLRGADSRHGYDGSRFDADALFQRSGTR